MDSWGKAQLISSLVGQMPPFFSSCTRFLVSEGMKGSTTSSNSMRYVVGKLWKSPTLRATLAYLIRDFFPEQLDKLDHLTEREVPQFLRAEEVAVVLCMRYLFKKIQSGCDSEAHAELASLMYRDMLIAGYLGPSIPRVGVYRALVMTGFCHLGRQMLLGVDRDGFKRYQRALKSKGLDYDFGYEQEAWGCTHVQIGSLLIQQVGLGITLANALHRGLQANYSQYAEVDVEARSFLIAQVWLQALIQTGDQPQIVHKTEYYPDSAQFNRLISTAQELARGRAPTRYLELGMADIGPDRTPFLHLDSLTPEPILEAGEIAPELSVISDAGIEIT